ncbi:ATP-dependent Clp protease proteolytic subunit [Bradyrhizobium sp. JYMT SZCCT0428]|uniref:ATP-dependent Clp protease proteolytic subunit n=1 Tax=Bradyrhizobium sp. JYMT SZCCT0428 TaxID=2807673 RepID=UPI001BAC46CF|nr:ATP-dependent Clp protease proteolytic subunit [Bradyrhizobium sp. JYMT SZCCT0428]MBR1156892.1 ATP-dependent Clp protease proteolytic subunit [Bradyrhizobium sp. JYMT SZCCT0428]
MGMQKRGIAAGGLVSAGLALSVSIAAAAEIKSIDLRDDRVEISISGSISPGDADLLKARIKQANDAGKLVTSLRLNSDGGNLLEAVRIADAVRFAKISTNVGRSATCASACFLIFAAGEAKYANNSARIGVHGASDKDVRSSRAATTSMAEIAKALDVPSPIIRRMVNTPPGEVEWLSLADLRSMGADVSRGELER